MTGSPELPGDLEEKIVLGMYDRGLLGFPENGIRLKSGRLSPYYYNDRPSLSFDFNLHESGDMTLIQQEEFRRALARGMGERILGLISKPDHVFGKAQAATAPAAVAAYEAGLSYLWERVDEPDKERYGAHKKIEGNFKHGQKVVIADDVVTDGKSKVEGAQVLRDVGLDPVAITIKFDRQEGGMETLEAYDFEANSVTSLTRVIPILFANNRIGRKQLEDVARYHQELKDASETTTYINLD